MLCWHFSLLLQLARANRLLSRAAKVNVLYTCCLCVYCLHSNRLIHMFTLLFTLPQFPIFHTEIKLLSHASYDHQTADCAQWLKMWYLDETLTYTSMQTKLYIHIDIAKKKNSLVVGLFNAARCAFVLKHRDVPSRVATTWYHINCNRSLYSTSAPLVSMMMTHPSHNRNPIRTAAPCTFS